MSPEQTSSPEHTVSTRLDSWKEIANHLGREIRTVQRWEKYEGLPIHRLQHQKRGSVYAYRQELDLWWRERGVRLNGNEKEEDQAEVSGEIPVPERKQRRAWFAVALALLVVVAAMAIWRHEEGRPQASPPTPQLGRLFGLTGQENHAFRHVAVPAEPTEALLSPDGRRLYVSSRAAGMVSVVDTRTLQLTASIAVGPQPGPMALSADGSRLYVAQLGGNVSLIDTATQKVSTIPLQGEISDLALTPDSSQLYVAMGRAGLVRIETNTLEVHKLSGPECPEYVAISPKGSDMVVSYQCGGPGGSTGHDTIDVYRLPSEEVEGTIRGLPLVGGNAVFSPDGAVVWVNGLDACINPAYDHVGCPASAGGVVHAVRIADRIVLASVALPEDAGWISMMPDGSHVVANTTSAIASVNTHTFMIDEAYPLASTGNFLVALDGRVAYTPVPQSNMIAVFEAVPGLCVTPPSLEHFWPGDGNLNDVARGLRAVARGPISFAPGRIGQSFIFDGSGSIDVPPWSDINQSDFTAAFWVKFDSGDKVGGSVALFDSIAPFGGGSDGIRLYRSADGKVGLCMGAKSGQGCAATAPQSVTSSTVLQSGVWYHVAAVVGSDMASLYVNGVAQGETHARGQWSHHSEIRIGDGNFHGKIDEIQVYARPLGRNEIMALYRTGNAGQCSIAAQK